MRKIFFILCFLLFFGVLGVVLGKEIVQLKRVGSINISAPVVSSASSYSSQSSVIPSPSMADVVSEPALLTISKVGVLAHVEKVQQDSQGRMDVPKKAENVGWYSLGVKPGQVGNAVMAGHLDKASGEAAVFFNLNQMAKGDLIEVKAGDGKVYRFKVVDKKTYPWNEFPLQKVFGQTDKKNLNLITCGGSWDSKAKNYSNRVVVYSELVES